MARDLPANSLYREAAREYARHADASLYNAEYERPAMLEAIGAVRGLRVIDAGCAAGFYTTCFAKDAAHVTALDLSPEMIALVRAHAIPSVDARVHDLADPFAWIGSETIDLVISSLALHYVEDWHPVMREFARVLRPDARLVFSTHHPAMTMPWVKNYFETQLVRDRWNVAGVMRDVTFYHRSMEAIIAPVLAAGLVIEALIEPRFDATRVTNDEELKLASRPRFLIATARRISNVER